jgi:hypothetical protein
VDLLVEVDYPVAVLSLVEGEDFLMAEDYQEEVEAV